MGFKGQLNYRANIVAEASTSTCFWAAQLRGDFEYTPEMIAAYPENYEFVNYMLGLEEGHAGFSRGMEVRRMVPHIGAW